VPTSPPSVEMFTLSLSSISTHLCHYLDTLSSISPTLTFSTSSGSHPVFQSVMVAWVTMCVLACNSCLFVIRSKHTCHPEWHSDLDSDFLLSFLLACSAKFGYVPDMLAM